jgi:Na+-driven multidrug efflux pump
VLALTQALGVGATALVSQALGRRDRERAELLFNQASVATVALQMLANLWLLQREFGRRLRDAPEPALAAGPA